MRFLFFRLYTKAEKGFIPSKAQQTAHLTTHPDHLAAALALGLGSGITHSLVTYVSVLWEAMGPGSYFCPACPSTSLFIMSALQSFCFILFHVFWSVIAFDGYKQSSKVKMGGVIACHLIASLLTMLNLKGGSCAASVVLLFLILAILLIYSWRFVANAHATNMKSLFSSRPQRPARTANVNNESTNNVNVNNTTISAALNTELEDR